MGSRVLLLFLIWTSFLIGQTDRIKELKTQLKNTSAGDYIEISVLLAEEYLDFDLEESIHYSNSILSDETTKQYPNLRTRAELVLASAMDFSGNYSEAHDCYDSLIQRFEEQQKPTLKAKSLIGKGNTFMNQGNFEKAEKTFLEALTILRRFGRSNDLGITYRKYGQTLNYLRKASLAKQYLDSALTVHKDLGEFKELSNDLFRLAVFHYDQNDLDSALKRFTESRSLKMRLKDYPGLAKVNNSLGVLHSERGNYQTSVAYHKQSAETHQKIGDKQGEAIALNNLGIAFTDWGKLDSAYHYHSKSLQLNKEIEYPIGIIRSYANIGEVYQFRNDLDEAVSFYQKAKNLSDSTEGDPLMRLVYYKLGELYLAKKVLDSSEFYLKKSEALRKEQNNYFGLRGTYEALSKLYEEKKDYPKALEYHKIYKQVQDSFANSRAAEKLAAVQARFDTERQEKEIIQLKQENERKTLWQNIFGISAFLAAVLGILIYMFFRYRNEKNKELLEVKEAQRQQLEELDRAKSRFFNNISHEFRTPLSLMLGPLPDLRESVSDSKKKMVDMVARNGKRMLKLINQLLELSKLESGNLKLKASYIDIVPFLRTWVQSFESLAGKEGINLNFTTEDERCFLYVDLDKFEEIVLNLLSNAFKYSERGDSVLLSLKNNVFDEKEVVEISVRDTGIGIAEQELDKVFDRFYQASNAHTKNVVGTGIGLSLVKEFTELHHGKIKLDSNLGSGSMFTVLLPKGNEHLSEDEIVSIPTLRNDTDVLSQEAEEVDNILIATETDTLPHVLIVEDNTDLRFYMQSILGAEYRVELAIDGEQGIKKALEEIPDLIISDVMMPKKDGFELCSTLKNELSTSHIPIILLTARSTKEDKLEGIRQLADAYLTKPFEKEELLTRIESLLEIRRKMQAHFGTGNLMLPEKVAMTSMDEKFITSIREKVEEEFKNPAFGVEDLAGHVALSRSQLFRKMRSITNITPNEYIRNFRLQRAMDMLQQKSGTVAEVAYEVGFENPSYFSKCFHERYGQSPVSLLKK